MTNMSGPPLSCAEFDDMAVDVTVGTLVGADRTLALAHLGGCERCRAMIAALTESADALLALAPAEEPPLGFEGRLLERAMQDRVLHRRARTAWRRVAAAAAVAAAVTTGAVVGHMSAPRPTVPGARIALARADGGRAICQVVVLAGSRPQLFVTIDEPAETRLSDYTVLAQLPADSVAVPVGVVHLVDGHGALVVALDPRLDHLQGVRVFDGDELRYHAQFD